MEQARKNQAVIVSSHLPLNQIRGWWWWLGAIFLIFLAGCTPQRVSSIDEFRDTKLLETQLKKGISTVEDIKRILGEPTGSGAVFLASANHPPADLLFYQDMELTDIKVSDAKGAIELKFRQQILVMFVRDGLFDGFMWFSNSEAATGWIKDPLRGKVGR